jgi:ABC-type uncharacterized transport system substrate-binding protein
MHLPLMVETENMVRAGALFAVVPDGEGVGRQAARLVKRILDGEQDVATERPNEVQVVLNVGTLDAGQLDFDYLLLDFVDVVVE